MKKTEIIFFIFFLLLVIKVFYFIFIPIPISGGDYQTFWLQNLLFWKQFPFTLWDGQIGLGASAIAFFYNSPYRFIIGLTSTTFSLPFTITERIFWWIPFFIFSVFSPYFFIRYLFPKMKFTFLASFIFLFNTYILMIVGGGQIAGIGLSYALSPLVLLSFVSIIGKENKTIISILTSAVMYAVLIMLDLRIAYIITCIILSYFIFFILTHKRINFNEILQKFLLCVFIPFGIAGLINLFWILPLIFLHQNPLQQLGSAYSTVKAVQFFSFATFENALGLMHPNWPENIFGKIGFMKPEFIILPILAFSSLFFIHKSKTSELKKTRYVIFFSFIALLGIFLAKGTRDPFGNIYIWMFIHVPGFEMFRDPTKWYLLIALAYSILIPFTVENVYDWIKEKNKFLIKSKVFNIQNLFLLLSISYLLFLIRPAITNKLTGVFISHPVPKDYGILNEYLMDDKNFSRVLWIPSTQRFGFYSMIHPAVSAQDFFNTTNLSSILKNLENTKTERLLQEAGIRYVIVPYDSEGELFTQNHTYSEKLYQSTFLRVNKMSWLQSKPGFGKIAVFTLPLVKDHFWLTKKGIIKYSFISPTKYIVHIVTPTANALVFSDTVNYFWVANYVHSHSIIHSQVYNKYFNSFYLPKEGTYDLEVVYQPQEWVLPGLIISASLFLGIIFVILYQKR